MIRLSLLNDGGVAFFPFSLEWRILGDYNASDFGKSDLSLV